MYLMKNLVLVLARVSNALCQRAFFHVNLAEKNSLFQLNNGFGAAPIDGADWAYSLICPKCHHLAAFTQSKIQNQSSSINSQSKLISQALKGQPLVMTPLVSKVDINMMMEFNNPLSLFLCSALFMILLAKMYTNIRQCHNKVFLVDLACYKPEDSSKCTFETFNKMSVLTGVFSDESLSFQKNIIEKSGLGPSTYIPDYLFKPNLSESRAVRGRNETESIIFGAIDEVLDKTGVKAADIGILVVNSSLYNPSPSWCSMIINKYKLSSSILSYNLGGMGCSAGLISMDLVKQLLKVHPNSYALVVSTENSSLNWYLGNNRSKLVQNCLFRMGGAAILLSNRESDRYRSKYQLLHTVRVNKGADDSSYKCTYQDEDEDGKIGITLTKDLPIVAQQAIRSNLSILYPLVLPITEKLKTLAILLVTKVFKMQMKPYVPNVKLAFNHLCIHPGGKGLLDRLEKSLRLSEWQLEPSRMTLYRFGNTSSSSVWYELTYSEAKGRIKKGDRVCQIALGAGFECNSVTWHALRNVDPLMEKKNPWMDEIEMFPVQMPK